MTTSPLKAEDSRAQFEFAYSNLMGTPVSVLKNLRDGNEYRETEGDRLSISWTMWQASRAAIVVDIASHTEFEIEHMVSPEKDGYSTGWIDGRNYAASQVRAAGITVKGDSDGK